MEKDDRGSDETADRGNRKALGESSREPDSPPSARVRAGRRRRLPRRLRTRAGSPGSSAEVGAQARRTSAPTARKCQRSRGLATSHASEASPPAIPARMTDGCQPTASTYKPIPTSVTSSRPDARKSEQPPEPVDAQGEKDDVLTRDGEQVMQSPEARKSSRTAQAAPRPRRARRRARARAARRRSSRPTASSTRSRMRSPTPGDTAAAPDLSPVPAHATRRGSPAARARLPRRIRRSAGRGSGTRTTVSRIVPRGGERPTGSRRSTRSSEARLAAKRSPRLASRTAHGSFAARAPSRRAAPVPIRRLFDRARSDSSPRASALPTTGPQSRATRRAQPPARVTRSGTTASARTPDEHDPGRGGSERRVRSREPGAGRAGQQRGPVLLDDSPHGVTRSRSCSIRVGPMPGTASRSSTDLNGPCSAR